MPKTPDSILGILGTLVIISGVTTVLMRGSAAAQVITSLGNGFSSAIRSAQGR